MFSLNICFVIFLWLKYMLHALVDMLKLSYVLKCTRVCYECLLCKDETLEIFIHYKNEVEK